MISKWTTNEDGVKHSGTTELSKEQFQQILKSNVKLVEFKEENKNTKWMNSTVEQRLVHRRR